MVPTSGFSIKLTFATPSPNEAGKDAEAGRLAGMQPLMERMAKILREQVVDFESLMGHAVDALIAENKVDTSALLDALNRVREASGEAPLVSAEHDTAEAVQAAVQSAQAEWAKGEEARMADRLRIAIEADRQERGDSMVVPPPRGAPVAKRR